MRTRIFMGIFPDLIRVVHTNLSITAHMAGISFILFIFFSKCEKSSKRNYCNAPQNFCKQRDFLLFLARILLISPPFIFVVRRRFCIRFTHFLKAASSSWHHASIIALISRHSFNDDGALNLIFMRITAAKLQFIIHAPTWILIRMLILNIVVNYSLKWRLLTLIWIVSPLFYCHNRLKVAIFL